jgi:flavin reductase (DIM6/NTAB) family NADH-FMN oxidoreductase RutF
VTEAGRTFDELVSRLDYPMFVVTTYDGTTRAGCLVGFATQCSIDPPRFLVCISKRNHTHRVVATANTLAVHVLRAEQRETAALFGGTTGDEVDKFARVGWTEGPDGVPVLDECAGWFAGRILDRYDLGDHTGLLLRPVAGDVPDAMPADPARLLRFAHVRDLEPGHDA